MTEHCTLCDQAIEGSSTELSVDRPDEQPENHHVHTDCAELVLEAQLIV